MSSHYRASSSLRHVVFGTPSNNDALTIRFGCQQGVFERRGIDLELKTLFGGPAIADAFHSGTIEVGSLGSPSALVPMSKGARFQVRETRDASCYFGTKAATVPPSTGVTVPVT